MIADVRLFLGKSTSGKSTLARWQLRARPRVLIFDPNMEQDHGRGAVLCDDPEHLVKLVSERGAIRICWRGFATMDVGEAFEWACRAAWAGEGFTVLWDEVDRYIPSGRPFTPWADKLINAGRHRGCSIFAAARRPARIHPDLRDAATRVCVARITGANSLAHLRLVDGLDVDRIPALGDYEFVDWQEAAGCQVKKSPFD